MKRKISFAAAAIILAVGLYAQPTGPAAPTAPTAPVITLPGSTVIPRWQSDVSSAVNATTGRYTTEVDKAIDTVDCLGLEFDKTFFFLGGGGSYAGNFQPAFQGGVGIHAFGGYLGIAFKGDFVSGGGTDTGAEDGKDNANRGFTSWHDYLTLLYASEAIGGIRLDLLFDGDSISGKYGENAAAGATPANVNASKSDGITATVEWGKQLAAMTPKVRLGFKFPDYTVNEWVSAATATGDTKAERWDDAWLMFYVETGTVLIPGLSFSNELDIDFGTTIKGDNNYRSYAYSESGWVVDTLRVNYGKTLDFGEKFQLKLRPRLQFKFAGNDHKAKVEYLGYSGESSFNTQAPEFDFQLSIPIQLGVRWSPTQKLSFYTGVELTPLALTAQWLSGYKTQAGVDVKVKPSSWRLDSLTPTAGVNGTGQLAQFAGTFQASEKIGIELSFSTPLLQIGMPGGTGATTVGNPFTAASWLDGTTGGLIAKFAL